MLYYSKWYTQYCYTVHLQSEVIDLTESPKKNSNGKAHSVSNSF